MFSRRKGISNSTSVSSIYDDTTNLLSSKIPPGSPSKRNAESSSAPQQQQRILMILWKPMLFALVPVFLVFACTNFLRGLTDSSISPVEGYPLTLFSEDTPPRSSEFSLAYEQSLGLFDDIPTKTWKLLQQRVREHENHKYPKDPMAAERRRGNLWYQENYEPDFTCQNERRLGRLGDGGKWVCAPHRIIEVAMNRKKTTGKKCLIYSVGSNGEFSFEVAMGTLFRDLCEIHIFDFTDYSKNVPDSIRDMVHFHAWGLMSTDELRRRKDAPALKSTNTSKDSPVFHSLQSTIETLGHTNQIIDVFKIDCEGCEWHVYKDWLKAPADIRQILLEVHNVPPIANGLFNAMQKGGYVTFHKEPNIQWSGGNCTEYSFLKLSKDFFV